MLHYEIEVESYEIEGSASLHFEEPRRLKGRAITLILLLLPADPETISVSWFSCSQSPLQISACPQSVCLNFFESFFKMKSYRIP